MKKVILIFVSFLLLGCPCEGPDCGPLEIDTPIFLRNGSVQDTLKAITIVRNSITDESDSLIESFRITSLYENFSERTNVKSIGPNDRDSIFAISSFGLQNPPWARYYYIINADSIANIPKEDFDQVRGVKKYFLKTLEDYEAIDFTLVYP